MCKPGCVSVRTPAGPTSVPALRVREHTECDSDEHDEPATVVVFFGSHGPNDWNGLIHEPWSASAAPSTPASGRCAWTNSTSS